MENKSFEDFAKGYIGYPQYGLYYLKEYIEMGNEMPDKCTLHYHGIFPESDKVHRDHPFSKFVAQKKIETGYYDH